MTPDQLKLLYIQRAIEVHLKEIEHMLGTGYKLALVCKAAPEFGDADLLITVLERDEILGVVNRHLPPDEPTTPPVDL